MICIDTSVLIEGERRGSMIEFIENHDGPFLVPVMAAAEFLLGIRLVKNERIKQRAQTFYDEEIRPLVESFDEPKAQAHATLIAELRGKGRTLPAYDAAIAATALELECEILALDRDYDGIDGLAVLKP